MLVIVKYLILSCLVSGQRFRLRLALYPYPCA